MRLFGRGSNDLKAGDNVDVKHKGKVVPGKVKALRGTTADVKIKGGSTISKFIGNLVKRD